jgi:hypothetical protein
MRKVWSNIETKVFKALYPDNRAEYVARILGRSIKSIYSQAATLSIGKSKEFKESELSGRLTALMAKGLKYRFEKGHEPFNKGLTWNDFMSPENQLKSLETTFKDGHLPHNTKSDGVISIRKDKHNNSYKFIRISKGVWLALHVYSWIHTFGPVPKGFIVVFKSSDRMNCDPSNLELITMEQNMLNNTIHRYPAELKSTMKVLKKLTRQINEQ